MKLILFLIFLITAADISAQPDTLRIKTSAVCDNCKATIEKKLSQEKGVKSSGLDVDSKIVTVIYDPEITSSEKIKDAISNAGYDADGVKANSKAYRNLPQCCRKPKHLE